MQPDLVDANVENRKVAIEEEKLRFLKESHPATNRTPLIVALCAGTLALCGNAVVTYINGSAMRGIEQEKSRSALIVELARTGDRKAALDNLKFFVKHGLIYDPGDKIKNALLETDLPPVLPLAASQASGQSQQNLTYLNYEVQDLWSEVQRVSAGATNEGAANYSEISLTVPRGMRIIDRATFTMFEGENKPWSASRCDPGADCAWSRFAPIQSLETDGGTLLTTRLLSWSHNRVRLGRLWAKVEVARKGE